MMNTLPVNASAASFPLWRLVGRSIVDTLKNLRGLFILSAPWMALDWVVDQFMTWMFGLDGAYGITTEALRIIAISVISVPWHRQILLDEPLPRFAPVNGRVVRYGLFYGIFIMTWFVTSSILELPIIAPGGVVLSLVGAMAIIAAAARMSILFPGVAIDQEGMSFARAWKITEGATLRMLIGHIMLSIVILFPAGIVFAISPLSLEDMAEKASPDRTTLLFDLWWTVTYYAIVILVTAFVSHIYRHIMQPRNVDVGADGFP